MAEYTDMLKRLMDYLEKSKRYKDYQERVAERRWNEAIAAEEISGKTIDHLVAQTEADIFRDSKNIKDIADCKIDVMARAQAKWIRWIDDTADMLKYAMDSGYIQKDEYDAQRGKLANHRKLILNKFNRCHCSCKDDNFAELQKYWEKADRQG